MSPAGRWSQPTNSRVYHHAYGTVHEGNPAHLNTDRTFTGQKQDGTGLLYYNARYYDPTLGTFISPDTLVPDAGVLFDYNRYLYTRGNPLKYTDPSGHCAEEGRTSTVGSDAAQCWVMADTILAMWDSTDYWSNRYTSKEVFEQIAAIPSNDFAWMQQELQWFLRVLKSKRGANGTGKWQIRMGQPILI
jgi:RHS repeat-associated protein